MEQQDLEIMSFRTSRFIIDTSQKRNEKYEPNELPLIVKIKIRYTCPSDFIDETTKLPQVLINIVKQYHDYTECFVFNFSMFCLKGNLYCQSFVKSEDRCFSKQFPTKCWIGVFAKAIDDEFCQEIVDDLIKKI